MTDLNIRRIKGSILFATFLIAAIALYFQRGVGTIYYIHKIGVDENIIIGGFVLSAFACGFIGMGGYAWNILCYIPYLIYTGATWLNVSERIANPASTNAPPIAAACFYSLLLGFLVLDWYQDWKGQLWIKTR